MSGLGHIPVLLEEVIGYLKIEKEGVYVDCTLGLGGHALEILKRNARVTLIGCDIDEKSLLIATKRLQPYADRVHLYHSDFRYLPDLKIDFSKVRGVLLDLGISSYQLNSPERGFSFNLEGPLDMRMDLRNKVRASKIINKYSEYRLAQIFQEYGELKQARKLAKEIISQRKIRRIESTTHFRNIIEGVCRWRPQKGKTHPAAKAFQALRIEINQELKNLSGFIGRIVQRIPKKARIIALSFHSLEDRIIKQSFARLDSPNNSHALLKILTKKPVIPTEEEIASNFRARSAKLRAAERI